eukprot:13821285-Heterocapsa_arctica.AAC.1
MGAPPRFSSALCPAQDGSWPARRRDRGCDLALEPMPAREDQESPPVPRLAARGQGSRPRLPDAQLV